MSSTIRCIIRGIPDKEVANISGRPLAGLFGWTGGDQVPMPQEERAVVVTFDEGTDHLSGPVESFEAVQMDALLHERLDDALR